MKTVKKILIAVCAVILVAAAVVGVLYAAFSRQVPDLQKEMLRLNPINYNKVYIVGQPPYTDSWIFDTPVGMDNYWMDTHSGGNGIEIVLQQSKDGKLIMLSAPLSSYGNADDLYGKDVKAEDLTLDELRKINLAYDLVDEDGFHPYVGVTDAQLPRVSVVTLDDLFAYFGRPNRVTVRMFLRFYDESKIADLETALQTIYDGLKENTLTDNAVFCPQSDASASAADKACPDMLRAATYAEAKALLRDCMRNKTPGDLPYSTIYVKANKQFGSERFIHYVRNLGFAIVLSDVKADNVIRYRDYGVTALATNDAAPFIQILKDAKKVKQESTTEAD